MTEPWSPATSWAAGDGHDASRSPGSDRGFSTDDRESTSTMSLFEGDEGELNLPQRRALVALLKNRFISAKTQPSEWAAIAARPSVFRSRLNDLFLELVISTDHEVAYKRQVAPEGGGRFPTLLHDTAWGREETVLLVFLRTRYRSERAAGADRVFVDRVDLHEYVEAHRPASATDVAADRKRVTRAIEVIVSSDLLLGRRDSDRFEINNAIEVLLPVPKLQELLEWLRTQNRTEDDDPDGGGLPAEQPDDQEETGSDR